MFALIARSVVRVDSNFSLLLKARQLVSAKTHGINPFSSNTLSHAQ